jgi:hypothetical protein
VAVLRHLFADALGQDGHRHEIVDHVQLGVHHAGQRQTAEGVENLRPMPLVADFIDEGVVRIPAAASTRCPPG